MVGLLACLLVALHEVLIDDDGALGAGIPRVANRVVLKALEIPAGAAGQGVSVQACAAQMRLHCGQLVAFRVCCVVGPHATTICVRFRAHSFFACLVVAMQCNAAHAVKTCSLCCARGTRTCELRHAFSSGGPKPTTIGCLVATLP